jgi:type I restriction enzyme M protein
MDDDKITKALAIVRLREVRREGEVDPSEITALEHLIELYAAETAAKKAAKDAQTELDHDTLAKYGDLTDADVQALVLDDKWAATIGERLAGEVNSLAFALVARIQQLGERYAETVRALDAELERLEAKVANHLADMGVS